jgi:serine/threonine protein kinase
MGLIAIPPSYPSATAIAKLCCKAFQIITSELQLKLMLTAMIFRRKNTSVVVYDHASREMATLNTERDLDLEHASCPTCHQTWPAHAADEAEVTAASSPDVIDPQYFRMLSRTLNGSPKPSPTTSPGTRFLQVSSSPSNVRPDSPSPARYWENAPTSTDAHGISSSAFSQDYFRKFFQEEKVLGRGGKGVVLLVAHVLDGVQLGHFACKRVPVGDDHEWLKKILTEVQTLQNLSHQNLVSYRHVWLEDVQLSKFGPSVPCAFILQQYCNGGDLHNYVCGPVKPSITTAELKNRIRRRSKGGTERPDDIETRKMLSLDEIYSFFKDITSGLRFLHASGYIHRDLKPSNCLLHQVGGEIRVLVSDFGEVQATTAIRRSTGATGTISYCAPEVLRRESPNGPYQNFTVKSDIFSLGMILYFLCFATLPYRNADVLHEENEDVDNLREEILHWGGLDEQAHKRPELPEKLYIFLRRLLAINPQHRPSAAEVDHAIRTGVGLSDLSTSNDLVSSSFEDLSQSDRITLIDTPGRGSPTRRNSTRRIAQSTSVAPRSSSRLRQLSRPPSLQTRSEHDDGSDRARSPPQPSRRDSWKVAPSERVPLLLPPPDKKEPLSTPSSLLNNPTLRYSVRVSLVLAKILSLTSVCGERAVNPVVGYPLLIAAVLESTAPLNLGILLLTSIVHTLVLVISVNKQTVCVLEHGDVFRVQAL